MINGKADYKLAKKLGVGVSEVADNGTHTCPASEKEIFVRKGKEGEMRHGFCGSCRNCWDKNKFLIIYEKH